MNKFREFAAHEQCSRAAGERWRQAHTYWRRRQ